jgi:hypothetical protein
MRTLLTKVDDLIASLVIPLVVEEAKLALKQGEIKGFHVTRFPLLQRLRHHNGGHNIPIIVARKCVQMLEAFEIYCKDTKDDQHTKSGRMRYYPREPDVECGFYVIYFVTEGECVNSKMGLPIYPTTFN